MSTELDLENETPHFGKPLLPAGAVYYRQNFIRRTEQKLK